MEGGGRRALEWIGGAAQLEQVEGGKVMIFANCDAGNIKTYECETFE